jgi:hypothetical protein
MANRRPIEIICLLDRSSSMHDLQEETIRIFNSLVLSHRSRPGRANLTLILFDREVKTRFLETDIHQIPLLDEESYQLGRGNALFDAIETALDQAEEHRKLRPRNERPGRVVFVVLTDGAENGSSRCSRQEIQARIEHLQEQPNWRFVFFGANPATLWVTRSLSMGDHFDYRAQAREDLEGFAWTQQAIESSGYLDRHRILH